MNCPDKEQLMLYVDGELDTTESSEIKSHLETCENCRHEVEEFRMDILLFRILPLKKELQ